MRVEEQGRLGVHHAIDYPFSQSTINECGINSTQIVCILVVLMCSRPGKSGISLGHVAQR